MDTFEVGNTVTISKRAPKLQKEQFNKKIGSVVEIAETKEGIVQVKVDWGFVGTKWMPAGDLTFRTR